MKKGGNFKTRKYSITLSRSYIVFALVNSFFLCPSQRGVYFSSSSSNVIFNREQRSNHGLKNYLVVVVVVQVQQ